MIIGDTMVAIAAAEVSTPCNSPWLSSGVARDIMPCTAGVTTAPSAVNGMKRSATVPLWTKARTMKAQALKRMP